MAAFGLGLVGASFGVLEMGRQELIYQAERIYSRLTAAKQIGQEATAEVIPIRPLGQFIPLHPEVVETVEPQSLAA